MLKLVRNVALLRAVQLAARRRSAVVKAHRNARAVRIAAVLAGTGLGVFIAVKKLLAARSVRHAHLHGVLPLAPLPPSRKKVLRDARREAAERRAAELGTVVAEVHVEMNEPEVLAVPLREVLKS